MDNFVPFKANNFIYVEEHFTYLGRECLVVFTAGGYRCGYVSLRQDEIEEEVLDFGYKKHKQIKHSHFKIQCHGGLTFGDYINPVFKTKEKAFIGFDCGHYGDGLDKNQLEKYGIADRTGVFVFGDAKSKEFCIHECKSIAWQLNELQLKQMYVNLIKTRFNNEE